ncbi:GNAT family N-acetyltransferase [Myxococcus sp. RHSTA-1-4]|uniref:GNAT family N-acetyltransferase n=1 Tax=Myxococcus sp. RHSTA-1-4 TaxID=2874601 RepID=UPI001CBC38AB|nr:GNAT family N-acetyltransferase [Myxococcus sp. RHSTA-1-4]MBZ4422051.1 GNAT family N-acetyltransferase [Myxococcus sp. RHSTA-1-4]
MKLRPYTREDRDAVLAVFRSNIPGSFEPHEEPEFLRFVDTAPGPYWVVEEAGRVVACGGIAWKDGRVDLCWGMVEQALHRQGIGLALTAFRLRQACEVPDAREVHLNTSSDTVGFYTRLGFSVDRTVEDAIRPGLHLLYLHLDLTETSRGQLLERLSLLGQERPQLTLELAAHGAGEGNAP